MIRSILICVFLNVSLTHCKIRSFRYSKNSTQQAGSESLSTAKIDVVKVSFVDSSIHKIVFTSYPPQTEFAEYRLCNVKDETSCSEYRTNEVQSYIFFATPGPQMLSFRVCEKMNCGSWQKKDEPIEFPKYAQEVAEIITKIGQQERSINGIINREKFLACVQTPPVVNFKDILIRDLDASIYNDEFIKEEFNRIETTILTPPLEDLFLSEYFVLPQLKHELSILQEEGKKRGLQFQIKIPDNLREFNDSLVQIGNNGLQLTGDEDFRDTSVRQQVTYYPQTHRGAEAFDKNNHFHNAAVVSQFDIYKDLSRKIEIQDKPMHIFAEDAFFNPNAARRFVIKNVIISDAWDLSTFKDKFGIEIMNKTLENRINDLAKLTHSDSAIRPTAQEIVKVAVQMLTPQSLNKLDEERILKILTEKSKNGQLKGQVLSIIDELTDSLKFSPSATRASLGFDPIIDDRFKPEAAAIIRRHFPIGESLASFNDLTIEQKGILYTYGAAAILSAQNPSKVIIQPTSISAQIEGSSWHVMKKIDGELREIKLLAHMIDSDVVDDVRHRLEALETLKNDIDVMNKGIEGKSKGIEIKYRVISPTEIINRSRQNAIESLDVSARRLLYKYGTPSELSREDLSRAHAGMSIEELTKKIESEINLLKSLGNVRDRNARAIIVASLKKRLTEHPEVLKNITRLERISENLKLYGREAEALQEINKFIRMHPGQKVALIYGGRHVFTDLRPKNFSVKVADNFSIVYDQEKRPLLKPRLSPRKLASKIVQENGKEKQTLTERERPLVAPQTTERPISRDTPELGKNSYSNSVRELVISASSHVMGGLLLASDCQMEDIFNESKDQSNLDADQLEKLYSDFLSIF